MSKVQELDLLKMKDLKKYDRRAYEAVEYARLISNTLEKDRVRGFRAFMLSRQVLIETHTWNTPTGYSLNIILEKLTSINSRKITVAEIAAGSGLITCLLRFMIARLGLNIEILPSDPYLEAGFEENAYIKDIQVETAIESITKHRELFFSQGALAVVWSRGRDFTTDLLKFILQDFSHIDIYIFIYTEGYSMSCEPEEFFDLLDESEFNKIVDLDREESVEFYACADKHDHLQIWKRSAGKKET